MSNLLQIRTRGWHFTDVDYFTRLDFQRKFFFSLLGIKMFNYLILPVDLVAKSATADFVLFNSVLVEAKFVFVVFKSFVVAESFHSIKI
jgi:hypothetical protein